jgi:hypothetical protein
MKENIGDLFQLLWATQGITKREADFEFRACPSAGALYEDVNSLLGIDGKEESVLYMSVVGHPW